MSKNESPADVRRWLENQTAGALPTLGAAGDREQRFLLILSSRKIAASLSIGVVGRGG
jgi:hypothetical protein